MARRPPARAGARLAHERVLDLFQAMAAAGPDEEDGPDPVEHACGELIATGIRTDPAPPPAAGWRAGGGPAWTGPSLPFPAARSAGLALDRLAGPGVERRQPAPPLRGAQPEPGARPRPRPPT
ncbi:MAG: hypothetical protein ACXU8N_02785 [Telluria sp.]